MQMQNHFPKINIVAVLSCVLVMYVAMVQLDWGIHGYFLGFVTRFFVEVVWELAYMFKYFPSQIQKFPSLSELRINLLSNSKFSFLFAVGFSSEIVMFEIVPFILLQSKRPQENIALWMSLYQISALSTLRDSR